MPVQAKKMKSSSADDLRASANETQLTTGSLWKAIWVMSWPLVLTTVSSSIIGMADVQVAGYLGSAAQAAVGLSEQVIFMFMIFIMSIGIGTTAIVSRAYGAANYEETVHATAQSLSMSVIMGLLLSSTALLTARFVLPLFSSAPQVLELGSVYLSIFGLCLIPFSIIAIINSAFRAIGDTKTPLLIMLVLTVINIIGDYATVLGNWPVPGLGIRGIAFSAIVADGTASVLALWLLSRSPLRDSLSHLWPLSMVSIKRVVNIGIPSALQRMSWAASTLVLFFILSRCPNPTEALASWTIGVRIEGLIFMPLMAFSLAVASIVGQNLGARQVKRAFKAGWHVTWIGVGLMTAMSIGMFIFAEPLALLMTRDPGTVAYTASYLRINAIAEPFLAVNMILSGALQGAGDTRTPMWISLFSNWIVRLPLAWAMALPFHFGPTGAWIAMTISVIIMGLAAAWRFQSGGWIKIRV